MSQRIFGIKEQIIREFIRSGREPGYDLPEERELRWLIEFIKDQRELILDKWACLQECRFACAEFLWGNGIRYPRYKRGKSSPVDDGVMINLERNINCFMGSSLVSTTCLQVGKILEVLDAVADSVRKDYFETALVVGDSSCWHSSSWKEYIGRDVDIHFLTSFGSEALRMAAELVAESYELPLSDWTAPETILPGWEY